MKTISLTTVLLAVLFAVVGGSAVHAGTYALGFSCLAVALGFAVRGLTWWPNPEETRPPMATASSERRYWYVAVSAITAAFVMVAAAIVNFARGSAFLGIACVVATAVFGAFAIVALGVWATTDTETRRPDAPLARPALRQRTYQITPRQKRRLAEIRKAAE